MYDTVVDFSVLNGLKSGAVAVNPECLKSRQLARETVLPVFGLVNRGTLSYETPMYEVAPMKGATDNPP